MPVGTRVQSAAINGHIYELETTEPGLFEDGQTQASIPVRAVEPGSGFNLAPGYYAILPVPVPGIVQVVNLDGWLSVPGADSNPTSNCACACVTSSPPSTSTTPTLCIAP